MSRHYSGAHWVKRESRPEGALPALLRLDPGEWLAAVAATGRDVLAGAELTMFRRLRR